MKKEPEQRDEAKRWAEEAKAMFAPPGAHAKGSHHYPSFSGGDNRHGSAPPLGHKPTTGKPEGCVKVPPLGHVPKYRKPGF